MHRFKPRGAAKDLFENTSQDVAVVGPAGTGKSRAILEKIHVMCLLNPGIHVLIVRKTVASLKKSGLRQLEEHVLPEAIAHNVVRWYGGSGAKPEGYYYSNGSTISIGGMDNPDKVMSTEYDFIFVQEATDITEEDWDKLKSRLRGKDDIVPFRQLIADANPNAPTHWLKIRMDQGLTQVIHAKHTDNPVFYNDDLTPTQAGKDYVEGILANLTGLRKERLYYGRWVGAEGIIYDTWDESIHLIDKFDIPEDWTRYWTVDFGYTNPFVCQFWAEDDDGRLYLYREIYMTEKRVDEHAKTILDLITDENGRWIEPRPQKIIADHDAENRATFEQLLGQATQPAHKAVLEGIQSVQERLVITGDGKPRIFIMKDAIVQRDQKLIDAKRPTCTAEEVVRYVWNKDKEAPVKEHDHGMDALRYMVADRSYGSVFRMEWA